MQFVHICCKTSQAQLFKDATFASSSYGSHSRFDEEVERCRVISDQPSTIAFTAPAARAGAGFVAALPAAPQCGPEVEGFVSCYSGDQPMLTDVLAHPRSFEQPLSSLCRAVGLAAVAAELNLQVHTLDPVTAAAVERGAAALFLAGYRRRSTGHAAGGRLNEKVGERGRLALAEQTRSTRTRTKKTRSR
jgi:hypothetical protein